MDYENNKPALTQGWRAIELANQVFSFNGWSCSIVDLHQDFVRALRLSANTILRKSSQIASCECVYSWRRCRVNFVAVLQLSSVCNWKTELFTRMSDLGKELTEIKATASRRPRRCFISMRVNVHALIAKMWMFPGGGDGRTKTGIAAVWKPVRQLRLQQTTFKIIQTDQRNKICRRRRTSTPGMPFKPHNTYTNRCCLIYTKKSVV